MRPFAESVIRAASASHSGCGYRILAAALNP
jgi:hypothetical protein